MLRAATALSLFTLSAYKVSAAVRAMSCTENAGADALTAIRALAAEVIQENKQGEHRKGKHDGISRQCGSGAQYSDNGGDNAKCYNRAH